MVRRGTGAAAGGWAEAAAASRSSMVMARTDTPFPSDFQRLIEQRPAFVETVTIGREPALTLFRAAPAWQSGTVSWRAVQGGVSADGTQGFTYGYLTVTAGDPARRERKYLAYWVRRPEGWRVAAWRQVPLRPG